MIIHSLGDFLWKEKERADWKLRLHPGYQKRCANRWRFPTSSTKVSIFLFWSVTRRLSHALSPAVPREGLGERRGCFTRGVRVTPCGHLSPGSSRTARARKEQGTAVGWFQTPARAFLSSGHQQGGDSSRREEEEGPPFDSKGKWLSEPPGASAKSEAWSGIRG